MELNWTSFVLLLVTLSAIPVQEVTSLSLLRVPLKEFRGRTRRQASETENLGSSMEPSVRSPCPEVLTNVRFNRNSNRWTGSVTITPNEGASGVAVGIQLDKRADLIGSSFGEISTNDNVVHTISNSDMQVEPGQIIRVPFFVKYDREAANPPNVLAITFNGRLICSSEGFTPATEPPLPATPEIVYTNPLPTTQSSSLNTGSRPGIHGTTETPSSMASRPPPVESNQHEARVPGLYEINGEIKIRSNASLTVLLIAHPPQLPRGKNYIEPESQTENLEYLFTQVFGLPENFVSSTTPESASPQSFSTRNAGSRTEDAFDEDPPYTSNPGASRNSMEQRMTVAPSVVAAGALGFGSGRSVGASQWASPCPGVFSYLANYTKSNMWYGSLTLTADEEIVGVRLDIELDKPTGSLGAWLGEVTSDDKISYSIWNPSADIQSGETINVRIFSKFDREDTDPPRISKIRLNGRQICP